MVWASAALFLLFFCKSPISTIFSPKVVFGSFWSILCVTPSLQTCLATTFYGYMYKKKTKKLNMITSDSKAKMVTAIMISF